jgi:hypothetical protein
LNLKRPALEISVPQWLASTAPTEFRGTVADLDVSSEDEPEHSAAVIVPETGDEISRVIVPDVDFKFIGPDFEIGGPILDCRHRFELRRPGQTGPCSYVIAKVLALPEI